MFRLLAFTLIACSSLSTYAVAASAAAKLAPKPQTQLAATANLIVERGVQAELPPHIATLLGLTRDESCKVRQRVLRSDGQIQGIDVTEKIHNDVVIFTVDEATGRQMLYLTSPRGALRRLLVVEKGVGHVAKPSKADAEEFEKEKKTWNARMTDHAVLK
ncbi:hypothetical protein [Occallatibacter savannae]|uniref:hypothetical protein n=1 Tax=Occallatibacter savannae TaxID=1002691 RepID=UPI0019514D4F|nr:hypothetical protein [Occallatibacter savannae]